MLHNASFTSETHSFQKQKQWVAYIYSPLFFQPIDRSSLPLQLLTLRSHSRCVSYPEPTICNYTKTRSIFNLIFLSNLTHSFPIRAQIIVESVLAPFQRFNQYLEAKHEQNNPEFSIDFRAMHWLFFDKHLVPCEESCTADNITVLSVRSVSTAASVIIKQSLIILQY